MKLPLLILAALPTFAQPEFELWAPWFVCDAERGVTNGVTCVRADDETVLTPKLQLVASSAAVVETSVVFTEDDVGAARELAACGEGVQFAIAVASTARARLAYFLWTSEGWIELSGAEPRIGEPVAMRFEIDYGQSPAMLRVSAKGESLIAAEAPHSSAFALADSAAVRFDALSASGAIGVVAASGEREMSERVAAVTQGDVVIGYYPTLGEARSAAGSGRVVLLRRTTLRDTAALSGETVIHGTALNGTAPALTFAGDASLISEAKPVLALPAGWSGDAPLIAPATDVMLSAIHIHGDEGVPYAIYPSEGALWVRRDELAMDGGHFTAFLTVPDCGRSFLRGLRNGMCGSENALYVNGCGALTLCGTNDFTGRVFIESSALQDSGVLRQAKVGVLSQPAGLEFVLSNREGESPIAAAAENRVVMANVTDELAGALSVRLDPGAGRVGFLSRVGSDLVASVASRPSLAAENGFSASPDASGAMMHLVAGIANAVPGFRYGWQAAASPSGPFASVGETVTATSSGPLEISLDEPADTSRFYRFKVEAP